jgi:hypothetical protein
VKRLDNLESQVLKLFKKVLKIFFFRKYFWHFLVFGGGENNGHRKSFSV